MREIKFRAWSHKCKEMIAVVTMLSWPQDASGRALINGPGGVTDTEHADLMQYTGLKDKNGVEIYEGDLFVQDGVIYEVVFKVGYFGAKPRRRVGSRGRLPQDTKPLAYMPSTDEVIANIYENPELLAEVKS